MLAKKPKTLMAIQPNAGIRVWYQQELDRLLGEAHLEIALELSLALHKKPVKLAGDATPVGNLNKTLERWADKWTMKFDKLSLDLAERFGKKAVGHTETSFQNALKRAGFTVKFKPTRKSMEAYKSVVAENVALIKNLPAQYVTNVQSAVWASVNKGADMAELSKKLHEEFGIVQKRAARISIDQNNKAKARIENTRRLQINIEEAIWQHSSAGKEPRPTHVAMNGKKFNLKKGMWDPDANGKGKGAWIWPGELINCRCTSRAIIKELGDG
jgi:uncharacterized protein with gpF-like domain